ncbi:MAG: hypothetical protein NT088_01090 [Candidatus Omnitrophica bacterium]|nr:hypothetical protein [Candidatus Omnitrophota bacterium]
MKNTNLSLAVITACLSVVFSYGPVFPAGSNAISETSFSEFKPGTVLGKEIDVTKTSKPLTDAARVELLRRVAADSDTSVVPQWGRLDIFLKGNRDKSYSYRAGEWAFWDVITDSNTHIKIRVIFSKETNPFENKLSPLNNIVREGAAGRLSIPSLKGILDWAKTNHVTIYSIEDSERDIIYVYAPKRNEIVMINKDSQALGEYKIEKNTYVEPTKNTAADNAPASPGSSSLSHKPQSSASSASKASPEAQMRQALRGYKIGVTTQKQCMNDITAGSWDVNFGGMGMEILSGKVTLGMTVGIGGRDVCDLVFEGDNPQQTGTGKTPDFGKFLLKEITFK